MATNFTFAHIPHRNCFLGQLTVVSQLGQVTARNANRAELFLTRAGRHLRTRARGFRAESGDTGTERLARYTSLEIVWEAKRVKAETNSRNAERCTAWRQLSKGHIPVFPRLPEDEEVEQSIVLASDT
jgi:hypothetical protein